VTREELAAQIAALGGPRAANAQVVGAREGQGTPEELVGKDQAALALLDRGSHGAMARQETGLAGALLGLPAAAAYEGAKAVRQNPGLGAVSPGSDVLAELLLRLSGGQINEKTSPASLANVQAYADGMLADPEAMRAPAPPRYAGQKPRP
jgi:hypothetical protein